MSYLEIARRTLATIDAAPAIDLTDATVVWQAALNQLEGDPLFPPDLLAELRQANASWSTREPDPPAEPIDRDNLDRWPDPCPKCSGVIFRWDALGQPRCVACDPGQSERVAQLAEKLRRQPKLRKPKDGAK